MFVTLQHAENSCSSCPEPQGFENVPNGLKKKVAPDTG